MAEAVVVDLETPFALAMFVSQFPSTALSLIDSKSPHGFQLQIGSKMLTFD